MLDSIAVVLQPLVTEYLFLLALAGAGWLLRRLPERHRMEIEEKHRQALHKALETGVALALEAAKRHPKAVVLDLAVSEVAGYVHRSVPEALRRLAPSQAHLEQMAKAKLRQHLDKLAGVDRLTDALNTIPGVTATKPQG